MMVEDKILEYLDGSLGESESAELLETLSVSPEKRALLEEHLRLKDLLALGRKPFAVPVETERELARRIPILERYSDNLAPARWGFSGVRQWIGARAIGVTAVAFATVALAGLGWYSMQQPRALVTENVTNGTNRNVAHGATAQFSSAAINFSAPIARVSVTNFGHRSAGILAGAQSLGAGNIGGNKLLNTGETLALLNTGGSIAHDQPALQKGGELFADAPDITPVTTLRKPAMDIPTGYIPHTMNEIRFGPADQLSPMTVGASMILDESYLPTLSTGPQHALQNILEDVTMDYDLTPNVAVGIELGEGMSSTLTNSQLTNPSMDYTRIINNVGVGGESIYDAMLSAHYTLFPESEYQLRLGAAAGTAFGAGPMAEATAGISRVIAPNLSLDVTAVASRIWTNGIPPLSNPSETGVVGIVGGLPMQSMYTTAFGVRAGLRVRL